jgi:hypothetical protein
MKHKRSNIGTVSHGTMKASDLVPAFIYELRAQTPTRRAHLSLCARIEKAIDSCADYDLSEDIDFDLEELFDALNEYAPEGFYFGAHPGDGADFGFWLSESFIEDFDGLKVDGLSQVPRGYSGLVLDVNDHGNVSLYKASRGRLRELWAIV